MNDALPRARSFLGVLCNLVEPLLPDRRRIGETRTGSGVKGAGGGELGLNQGCRRGEFEDGVVRRELFGDGLKVNGDAN